MAEPFLVNSVKTFRFSTGIPHHEGFDNPESSDSHAGATKSGAAAAWGVRDGLRSENRVKPPS